MKKLYTVLVIAILFINLIGCQEQQKKQQPVQQQAAAQISAQPDLKLSAVGQYLRNDGSKYLTQQQLEIYSNPEAIIITADEPYGKVVWSVQNGIYTEPQNKATYSFDKNLYNLMINKDITQSLMKLYLAGLGQTQIQDGNETLNFNGQIYEAVSVSADNIKVYKNKSTGKVDLVTSGTEPTYLVYGYNYQKTKKNDGAEVLYSSKVDIYIFKSFLDKKLVAQINSTSN